MMLWFEMIYTANKVRPRIQHRIEDILYNHQHLCILNLYLALAARGRVLEWLNDSAGI